MNLVKTNIVLLVVAGVLAVPTTVQLLGEAETFVDMSRIPLLFDGFTVENVGSVVLGTPKKEQPAPNPQAPNQKPPIQYDQLAVMRSDKGWVLAPTAGDLAGAPVNKDKVENDVFAHVRAIRKDPKTLVQASATNEQLEKYGLDEAHATVLKISDRNNQNIVAELWIGKDASEGITGAEAVRGVFVRKADSADVVLYEFEKGGAWNRSVQTEQWLDKVLWKLDPTQVQRVSLRNTATAGKTIQVHKEPGKSAWTCAEPPADRGALRQTEVESFVQRLRWITAQDFRVPLQRAGNLAALGLQPAQIEIEIEFKDGDATRTVKLQVGNKVDGKNENYLLCSENQFLMTWPAGMVPGFEVNPVEAWFDPAAPKEAPKDAPKDAPKEAPKEAPKQPEKAPPPPAKKD